MEPGAQEMYKCMVYSHPHLFCEGEEHEFWETLSGLSNMPQVVSGRAMI